MRTLTIEVPEVLDDIARQRGKSPEELAQQALARWIEEALEDADDERIALERWAEIESGKEVGEDWEDVKAELNALPD